ncbi:MAG: hypothetical protein M5R36_10135 [Deltaproteobacteria bacterium]|nr:hypothetical protein [Deltaproteobacteria bacterium]
MARFAAENNVLYARYGYYDAAGAFVPQGSAPLPLLPNDTGWQRLGVWVGPDTYHVLVNNEVVAANIPLQYRGGALGLVAGGGPAAFDDVEADRWEPVSDRIQVAETPVPVLQGEIRTAVDLGPLRFSDSFDDPEASEAQWLPFTGDWAFEPGFFVQRQVDGYDRSASAGERFESFVLRATFAHREGAGGGVLFNMARRDVLTEAHIVRYFGSSEVLAWGYFDADGVFQAQGTAAVPAAGTAAHTLEVRAEMGVYSVSLDSALVATDAPLMTGSGYIGLTSSESAVAFESVEVYDTASDADAATVLDLSASDGAWLSADGVITQLSSAQRDFVAGTGIAASAFRASVDVLLPQGEGLEFAGGGIAFHMTGRDNRAGGYVVRFATGGREVIWGAFDEGGAFKEQGNAPVEPEPGAPHTLTVVVRADNFDILVDGALIVSNLLLERADGWVGLVSFQGPVSFSGFQMTLSEAEGQ